jgi:hypothetical protein
MKSELQIQLCKKHPSIFREVGGSPTETCMAWGIECGNGWHDLIDALCTEIDAVVKHTNELYPHLKFAVVAAQVKEKYGGLRFYVDFIHDHELLEDEDAMKKITSRINEINGMIRIIESLSRKTCEECGDKCELDTVNIFPRAICNACEQVRRDAADDQLGVNP